MTTILCSFSGSDSPRRFGYVAMGGFEIDRVTKIIAEMKLARMDVGGYTRDHVLDCGNYLFLTGALYENGG